MVEINGKQYELVELTARQYQQLMDDIHSQFGSNWQDQAEQNGVKLSILMVRGCLRATDKSAPTEDEVWDLPIKQILALGRQAREINGLVEEKQQALEKN